MAARFVLITWSIQLAFNTIRKKSWSGNFKTSTPEKIILGERYKIQLDDGRVGEVLVTRVDLYGCYPSVIQFQGIGTLYSA